MSQTLELFDQVVVAGALSPNIFGAPLKVEVATLIIQYSHEGLGASAAGVIEISMDGVNWATGSTLTLTSATPLTQIAFGFTTYTKWYRARISHGGAAGGRVVIIGVPAQSAVVVV